MSKNIPNKMLSWCSLICVFLVLITGIIITNIECLGRESHLNHMAVQLRFEFCDLLSRRQRDHKSMVSRFLKSQLQIKVEYGISLGRVVSKMKYAFDYKSRFIFRFLVPPSVKIKAHVIFNLISLHLRIVILPVFLISHPILYSSTLVSRLSLLTLYSISPFLGR